MTTSSNHLIPATDLEVGTRIVLASGVVEVIDGPRARYAPGTGYDLEENGVLVLVRRPNGNRFHVPFAAGQNAQVAS